MEAQLILVLSGAYIGYLPEHYAEPWVGRRGFACVVAGDLWLSGSVFDDRAPYRSREPLIQTFRDLLKAQLNQP